uniref:Uncharacterized protein n=2 Tax=viral metagenome TaxID=1070528 RepID=A0A6H1ZHP6_9ZZZZ
MLIFHRHERKGKIKMLKCEDCVLPYKDFPLDTTIPNGQWLDIHPERDGGGVLCANCMIKRASKLPGVIAARMVFEFKPHILNQTDNNLAYGHDKRKEER